MVVKALTVVRHRDDSLLFTDGHQPIDKLAHALVSFELKACLVADGRPGTDHIGHMDAVPLHCFSIPVDHDDFLFLLLHGSLFFFFGLATCTKQWCEAVCCH